jgi:hypothetical protein
MSLKKYQFLFFLIYFGLGLLFVFKDFTINYLKNKTELINTIFYNEQHECSFSIKDVKHLAKTYPDIFKLSAIGFSDSNLIPIFINKIPVNYLIFYNTFTFNPEKNLIWQIKEINNIKKYSPELIITPKEKCNTMGNLSDIMSHINQYYRLSHDFENYSVYKKVF